MRVMLKLALREFPINFGVNQLRILVAQTIGFFTLGYSRWVREGEN